MSAPPSPLSALRSSYTALYPEVTLLGEVSPEGGALPPSPPSAPSALARALAVRLCKATPVILHGLCEVTPVILYALCKATPVILPGLCKVTPVILYALCKVTPVILYALCKVTPVIPRFWRGEVQRCAPAPPQSAPKLTNLLQS